MKVANATLQYYVHTKTTLPMDIEFVVQDIFALTRPQWKFATNLEEATQALHLAIIQDQKTAGVDKTAEADDATSGASSDDDNADADDVEQDGEVDEDSASDDDEAEVGLVAYAATKKCHVVNSGIIGWRRRIYQRQRL